MNIFSVSDNGTFKFKLGKQPKKFDDRNLKLASYIDPSMIPTIPDSMDWGFKINQWPMYMNDSLGCCTIAGVGHLIESWTSNSSNEFSITNDDVLNYYEIIGKYDPKDPTTDGGCIELDVLKYWKNNGFCGHMIDSFVEVNLNNVQEVKTAIYLFGGIYIGLALPNSAQNQDIWDVVSTGDGGSWGGHCTIIVKFDKDYLYTITWGQVKKMTYEFFNTYCDECYAIVSNDWLENNNISPVGLNLEQLRNDLKMVRK